jgi:hypothetical protein
MGRELVAVDSFGKVERDTPGISPVRLFALDEGRWIDARVLRWGGWLRVEPGNVVVPGMSGSPILSPEGAAIGVLSTGSEDACQCPVLVDKLSAELLRRRRSENTPAPPAA